MCKKLTFIVLALALASTSYGYIIGDWEGESMDDWTASDWGPAGNPQMYPGQDVGVTLNEGSLLVYGPIGPNTLYWQISLNLQIPDNPTARAAMAANNALLIDVTRPAQYWTEDTDPCTPTVNDMQIKIQGGGPNGSVARELTGLCPWDGTDATQTICIYYGGSWTGTPDGGWWCQIHLATAVEGYSAGGRWYLDNARFETIPEPMTIALLGFGGLTLLRKKR
ncbi:MAG: PEP-CTERM sorting domain-containing protein [Phycisphaerae bacterium]|nr:PEP-CTERM sorting domain-containing protein [Phycisphaerae bacterium]